MEQHMVNPQAIEGLFNELISLNQPILELGGGTGNLTREIYHISQDIIVWELDKSFMSPLDLPKVQWEHKNIMDLTQDDIQNRMIVSFPPYECLSHILNINQSKPAILMMSDKKLKQFDITYQILKTLEGIDFTPISSGIHHIILLNPEKVF